MLMSVEHFRTTPFSSAQRGYYAGVMPPPPPPPGAPPPPSFGKGPGPKLGGSTPTGSDRSALLKSIQQGKALKKTVTNDRSAPALGGNSNRNQPQSGPPSSGSSPSRSGAPGGNSGPSPRLPGIGGLFADGIPTLKKTQGGVQTGRRPDPPVSNVNSSAQSRNHFASKTPQNTAAPSGAFGDSGGTGGHEQRNYFNHSASSSSINNQHNFSSSSLDFVNARNNLRKERGLVSRPQYHTVGRKTSVPLNGDTGPRRPPPSPKPLSRTSSVGKLVTNFESAQIMGYGTLGRASNNNNNSPFGFRGATKIYQTPSSMNVNSTPSLTPPSASPAPSNASSNTLRKNNPPPPPPAGGAKRVQHPSSKPPPPPAPAGSAPPPKPPHTANFDVGNGRPAARAKSFNYQGSQANSGWSQQRGVHDDASLPAPPPPNRTMLSSHSMRRPGGPAPAPPQGGRGPHRVAPMKPPSVPPPPPPTSHPPAPPQHRMQPPAMPPMGQPNSYPSSDPPTPPVRRQSIRNGNQSSGYNSSSSNSGGDSFESRFQGRFKTPQFLPPPEPFTNCQKTYPSRNQQLAGRQGSMMKRTPAPQPPGHQAIPPQLHMDNRAMWAQNASRC